MSWDRIHRDDELIGERAPTRRPSPGKRTLTQDIPSAPQAAARHGVSGEQAALPHRATMERAFGRSFAGVSAHVDDQAADACATLDARAYALGSSVAFADPEPSVELVAHELTHVVQQAAGRAANSAAGTTDLEREADDVGARVAAGQRVQVRGRGDQRIARSPASAYAHEARVRHDRFGDGSVARAPARGDTEVLIRFDSGTTRRVPTSELHDVRPIDAEAGNMDDTLPFTGTGQWDSTAILNRLSQNDDDPDTRTDAVRCNAESVLAAHVGAGPQAVLRVAATARAQIAQTIAQLAQAQRGRGPTLAESPDDARLAHLRRLRPTIDALPDRLALHTATFRDLQRLADAMMVLSVPSSLQGGGTSRFIGMNFNAYNQGTAAEQISYSPTNVGWQPFVQLVNRIANHPGVAFVLGINNEADQPGAAPASAGVNHAITLGCDAQSQVYLYDPRPRRGDQRMAWPADQNLMRPYFVSDHDPNQGRRWTVANRVSSHL